MLKRPDVREKKFKRTICNTLTRPRSNSRRRSRKSKVVTLRTASSRNAETGFNNLDKTSEESSQMMSRNSTRRTTSLRTKKRAKKTKMTRRIRKRRKREKRKERKARRARRETTMMARRRS